MRTHEHAKLVHNTLQHAQPVVLSQGSKQVLHDALLIRIANVLLQLSNHSLLVRGGQGRRTQNLSELCVALEDVGERVERLGRGVEGIGFGGRSVLERVLAWPWFAAMYACIGASGVSIARAPMHSRGVRTRALAYVPSTP